MKPHRYGICLISRDPALRADVSAVLDRLNHWLGHETPHASQHWPDAQLQSLYRQVAGQAEAYLRQQAKPGALALQLLAFDDLAQAQAALATACPCDHVLLDTRDLQAQPEHDPLGALLDTQPEALPHDNRAQSIADFGKATLDTYVMLSPAQREKADPAFLKAHLPDYWYPAIARHTGHSLSEANQGKGDQDYLYASRQITFYADQIRETDVPRILDNAFLISSSRNYIDSLRAQSLRAIETITLESDTLFAFGRADFQSLKSEGQNQLSAIASKLLNTPNIGKIVISGHADQLGDSQSNLQVSKQRAQTIRTYLVGKGVPAELVVAQGEGSRKPLVNCDMQQARAQLIKCLEPNRRVEIEVRGLN